LSSPPAGTTLADRLVSSRTLARNTFLHFLGQALPLVFALVALPPVVRALGQDRVGLLSLAWAAIGSFSLFDLGLGRALTQLVAKNLGRGDSGDAAALFWNSTIVMGIVGLSAAGTLWFAAPWMVRELFHIPPELRPEALEAIRWLAPTLPFVIHTAGLTGILAAYQRFGVMSAVRIPVAALMYLGPLLSMPFSHRVVPVIAILAASRVLGWLAYLVTCFRIVPGARHPVMPTRSRLVPLLRFGGWMTLSNAIAPLMVYLDRFVLAAMVPVAEVAFYAVPYEVVTKLWIVPGTVASVLLPAFATTHERDRCRMAFLYRRGVKYVLFGLVPAVLALVTLAPEVLRSWMGGEFAVRGAPVVRLLAVGVLLNSLAYVPVGLLQGAGRPDLVAKLQLMETPFYVAGLWVATSRYGIEGAAAAWMIRVLVDTLALFFLVHRLDLVRFSIGRPVAAASFGLVVLGGAIASSPLSVRLAYVVVTIAAFLTVSFFRGLEADERRFLAGFFTRSSGDLSRP
jgi:O-antigen/teichoic acid export membrane protein